MISIYSYDIYIHIPYIHRYRILVADKPKRSLKVFMKHDTKSSSFQGPWVFIEIAAGLEIHMTPTPPKE